MKPLQQQKEFLKLLQEYNSTDKALIKANLKNYMDESGHKLKDIARHTGIAAQSIYQLRKPYAEYCPEFIPAMILCDYLQIPITALLQPLKVTA